LVTAITPAKLNTMQNFFMFFLAVDYSLARRI
jgi:hypothetical protein